jgi:carbon storage regulator CsrA
LQREKNLSKRPCSQKRRAAEWPRFDFHLGHDLSGPLRSVDRRRRFFGVAHRQPTAAFRGQQLRVFLSGSLALIQKSRGGQMQMITRRVNEGLVIGNDIHVTVLDICQDRVRLAISSPNNTPSYWEETLYLDAAEEETVQELMVQ